MNLVRSCLHLFLITVVLAGCQSADLESTIVVENFDFDELFGADTIVNYRELYEGDGEALMDAMLSDDLVLYEDVENTFSLILTDIPLVSDLEWDDYSISRLVIASGSVASIKKGIIDHHVAYFKADPPLEYTNEFQAELAQRIVPNFEPPHRSFRFRTNGIDGQEFWFFLPIEKGSQSGVHAKVRTIVHEDYIYILRIASFNEEAISGNEVDKFFASFELK